MCTLIALHRCFEQAPLVLAANRDEWRDRPAEPPALRRAGGRAVVAPRDVTAGGTWLGLNDAGLFAGLTNRPAPAPDPARRSRGLLVHDALAHGTARAAARAAAAEPEEAYNPFNLFVADGREAFVVVGDGALRVVALRPGAHVVGNFDPDDRSRSKGARLLERAERVAAGPFEAALDALTEICRGHDGGGRALDDTCIHAGAYGTRSSTLLAWGPQRDAWALRFADGPPCASEYEERTPLLDGLAAEGDAAPGQAARSPA